MTIDNRLYDRVDILDKATEATLFADVPADVYSLDSAIKRDTTTAVIVDELRAMLPADLPVALDTNEHYVRWHGLNYNVEGNPQWHRRRGVDHHQTVRLKHYGG